MSGGGAAPTRGGSAPIRGGFAPTNILLGEEGVGKARTWTILLEGADTRKFAVLGNTIVSNPERVKNSPRTATSVLTMRIVVRARGNINTRLRACLAILGALVPFIVISWLCAVDAVGNTNERGSGTCGKERTKRTVCSSSVSCC